MMHRVTLNSVAAELQNVAATKQKPGAQYNFAEIFGGGLQQQPTAKTASTATQTSRGGLHTAIATATAVVVGGSTRRPVTAQSPVQSPTATTATTATTGTATTSTSTPTVTPGVQTLVAAIMDGSFQPTYETDPSKLQEITPAGTDYMPNFYYASDQTAAQLAQLLGGTVVQMPAFGQDKGWSEPNANFIQLPNGQTFNAADVAYYARTGSVGAAQLTADITGAINQGSAWSNYYQHGGPMPSFAPGYVGPPISGSTYDAVMISAAGDVINPAMAQTAVKAT
jgi:hypothetical protein